MLKYIHHLYYVLSICLMV